MAANKVVLLTGAPGSGKTTLGRALTARWPQTVETVDFGRILLAQKSQSGGSWLTYGDIRARSAELLSPHDVSQADGYLIEHVQLHRRERTLLIDSHAVTREQFGFRITMSSPRALGLLGLDAIFLLECVPYELIRRVRERPEGRILMNAPQLLLHQALQRAVAVQYSLLANCPMFIFDSGTCLEDLVDRVTEALRTLGVGLVREAV